MTGQHGSTPFRFDRTRLRLDGRVPNTAGERVQVRAAFRQEQNGRIALWDGETNDYGRERWKFVPAKLVKKIGDDLWQMPRWLAQDRGLM